MRMLRILVVAASGYGDGLHTVPPDAAGEDAGLVDAPIDAPAAHGSVR